MNFGWVYFLAKFQFWCMTAGHCARSDSSQFLLPFQGSVLQNRDHVACQYAHSVFTEVWLTTVAKIRTIASSYWPRKRSVPNFWNSLFYFVKVVYSMVFVTHLWIHGMYVYVCTYVRMYACMCDVNWDNFTLTYPRCSLRLRILGVLYAYVS